jgi:hypothetical protein
MHPGQLISVFKLNLAGEETWRYAAKVLQVSDHAILLVAGFNRPERMFHGILLGQGDPFVEIYMNDRWYNNISLPAEFGDDSISYVDLALDLLVYPDGQMLVLDEDEFAELNLDETQQERARRALNELKGWFDQPVSLRLEKLDFLVCPLLRSPDQP